MSEARLAANAPLEPYAWPIPSLSAADVGCAVAGGTDIAIESSDLVAAVPRDLADIARYRCDSCPGTSYFTTMYEGRGPSVRAL